MTAVTTAGPRPARFGKLLTWAPYEDGYEAAHAGRRYRMIKLSRRAADERQTRPGWHMLGHPDDYTSPDDPRIGPSIAAARESAELWILTPPRGPLPTADSPSIRLVYGYGGAGFRTPSGVSLVADARPDGIITIHTPGPELAGLVRPVAHAASDGTLTITWHPSLPDGSPLEPCACWQAAAWAVAVTVPVPGLE